MDETIQAIILILIAAGWVIWQLLVKVLGAGAKGKTLAELGKRFLEGLADEEGPRPDRIPPGQAPRASPRPQPPPVFEDDISYVGDRDEPVGWPPPPTRGRGSPPERGRRAAQQEAASEDRGVAKSAAQPARLREAVRLGAQKPRAGRGGDRGESPGWELVARLEAGGEQSLREAILLREILGPPKALQRRRHPGVGSVRGA